MGLHSGANRRFIRRLDAFKVADPLESEDQLPDGVGTARRQGALTSSHVAVPWLALLVVQNRCFRPKRVPGESRFVCRPRSSDPLTTLNAALSGALGGATYRRLEQRASKVTRKEAIKLSIGLIVVLNVGLAAGMLVLLAGAMRLPYRLRAEPRGPQPPRGEHASRPTRAEPTNRRKRARTEPAYSRS